MTHRTATRADHERFYQREGWTRVRNARGKSPVHHITYELALPDGRILRTRISRPPDRSTYGPRLWRHILQDQLAVTETEFWDCVDRKVTPTRAALPEPGAGLPADVVHQLMTKVGVPEAEVAQMTREQAIARLAEFWTTGH